MYVPYWRPVWWEGSAGGVFRCYKERRKGGRGVQEGVGREDSVYGGFFLGLSGRVRLMLCRMV